VRWQANTRATGCKFCSDGMILPEILNYWTIWVFYGTNGNYLGSLNDNLLTNRCEIVTLFLIRVAARFFSGVPHPHLLGVCCPDFQFVTPKNLTLLETSSSFVVPIVGV
jgi:hypothetical protein